MSFIEIRNLTIDSSVDGIKFTAVNNLSLNIEEGQKVAILGESGAGKSLITKLMAGVMDTEKNVVSGGEIIVDGVNILEELKPINIGYVFRKSYLKRLEKNIHVDEQLKSFFIKTLSIDEEKAEFLLNKWQKKLDLDADTLKHMPRHISALNIEKAMIIYALASDPKLFIYDLPKNEVSIEDKKVLLDLIDKVQKIKGFTVFYSARDVDLVVPYCDDVRIMYYGEFINDVKKDSKSLKEKNPILSLKNVEVTFRVRDRYLKAIRRVSLDIYEGEALAIVGESGSGKSVLTKSFTGMLESNGSVTGGEIWFEGENLAKFKKNKDWEGIRGKKIATVFQDPMTSLNPIHSIGDQISEVIVKHQGKSKEEAKREAIELMTKVGIYNAESRYDEYPFQYSGGMRQRIVIAIALACRPQILICDEPTTALDVTIQAQIVNLIKELSKEYGFTTIYITHDLGVVAAVAERVAVMYGGQIIEIGTAEEVFFDPRHPYTWGLLSSMPQLAVKGEELYSIPGTPPSLYKDIKGDAFAPRSKYALKIDFVKEPPMFKVSETHFAKTWLCDPRAPKVEKPAQIQNIHEKLKALYNMEDK